ncbi:Glycosyltransferase 2-like domain-containing protein [Plasmodiophora brassicae]
MALYSGRKALLVLAGVSIVQPLLLLWLGGVFTFTDMEDTVEAFYKGADPAPWAHDVDLLVPIASAESSFYEVTRLLIWSALLFWPRRHFRLVIVTDEEDPETPSVMNQTMHYARGHQAVRNIEFRNNTLAFKQSGQERQQWIMFWADNFTDAEYIGLVDTDTVVTSRILYEDIFAEGDRPRVRVVYGPPLCSPWIETPQGTLFATGFKEKFKGMSQFPVVVKRAHLHSFREHIRLHLNMTTFDDAVELLVSKKTSLLWFAQFNLIVNVLYELFYDDYVWHVFRREPGWDGPGPLGQVANLAEANLRPQDMLLWPHVCMHWSYRPTSIPQTNKQFVKLMREGHCHGLRNATLRSGDAPWYCADIRVAERPWIEWLFEFDFFYDVPGNDDAHRRRRHIIETIADHEWDPALLRLLEQQPEPTLLKE